MDQTPLLDVRGLGKSFDGNAVLLDVTFTVGPGQVIVVRGENGVGKSTLLRCLVGDERPDVGEVLFQGVSLDPADPAIRAAVAVNLGPVDHLPYLTVREHLEFVARSHGDPDPGAAIDGLLVELRLARAQDRSPGTLSQGQRRRVGLAACLIRPRLLTVLDEPEQSLDEAGKQWLVRMISDERAAGRAVVLVSHAPQIFQSVADAELMLTLSDQEPEPTAESDG